MFILLTVEACLFVQKHGVYSLNKKKIFGPLAKMFWGLLKKNYKQSLAGALVTDVFASSKRIFRLAPYFLSAKRQLF